jgi:5-(carboxyamino)imidazole ribonucleotide synthase
MFTVAARSMGYRVAVLDPDPLSPAGHIADQHLQKPFTDSAALAELGRLCGVVTTEFENVPARALEALAAHCPVHPGPEALAIAQDRVREKTFARGHGIDTARFHAVHAEADLAAACAEIPGPAILKTNRLGYDGKGQRTVSGLEEARSAFRNFGSVPCILEELVPLERELSVVLARSRSGEVRSFPAGENRHVAGILDTTMVPAAVDDGLAERARAAAETLAAALDYVGVLGVELFVVTGGRLLFNEMAPRPHNSAHYTLDACVTDQFEQQVRAVCGLPLGDPGLLSPVCMVNLLGDLWREGAPRWDLALANPRAKLHLYGKHEARPGRKMGHLNVLADSPEAARQAALTARAALTP